MALLTHINFSTCFQPSTKKAEIRVKIRLIFEKSDTVSTISQCHWACCHKEKSYACCLIGIRTHPKMMAKASMPPIMSR